jgi:hypothetical protein
MPADRRLAVATNLERRVEKLERQVSELTTLASQISALRAEMQMGFLAIRQELGANRDELRTEIAASGASLRQELRTEIAASGASLRQELRAEIAASGAALRQELRAEIAASDATLREVIVAGDEESRRYMRIFYEDLFDSINTLCDCVYFMPSFRLYVRIF